MRDVPTSPHSAARSEQHPGASGDAFPPPGRAMSDLPAPASGAPIPFVAPDENEFFAFIETLRLSVRARVAAEQDRGLSLSEIVVQVPEMVRQLEVDPAEPNRFPSRAYRAIASQAVAWCIESYRPLAFADRRPPDHPVRRDAPSMQPVLVPGAAVASRIRATSPNYRGIP